MQRADHVGRLSARILGVAVILLVACTGGRERQEEYLDRAQRYFDGGNYAKAGVDVRNALQIDADHARARYLYARVLEKQQDWERMFANLQRAVELAPNLVPARIDYGTMLVANEMYDEALAQADAVIRLKPTHPAAHALKAAVYLRTGRLELAEQSAVRSLGYEPGNVGALGVLTEIYRQKDPRRALELIRRGLKMHPDDDALRLLEISVFEANRDIDAAERVHEALIAANPGKPYYQYLFVAFLEKHGRHERALAQLHEAIAAHPRQMKLKLWLVQIQVDEGHVDAARQALVRFLKAEPASADLMLALGQIHVMQGNLEQARELFRRYMEIDDESEAAQRARNALAQLELANGNRRAGIALLEETLEREPGNAEGLLIRARLALAESKFDAAIADLRAALLNAPDSLDVLLMLASAYEATGADELAIDTYRRVVRLQPENEEALVALTRAALAQGELDVAARLAATANRLHPDNEEVASMLVGVLSQSGKWPEATRFAREIAAAGSTRPIGIYLLGRIALARGLHQEAVDRFAEALAIRPTMKGALTGLVDAHYLMGNRELALDAVQRLSRAHPRYVHALELLAHIRSDLGEGEQARTLLERAIAIDPDNASPYVRLGELHLAQGHPEQALAVYARGLLHDPFNRYLLLESALAHERQGNYRQAADLYERALVVGGGLVAQNNLAMLYADHLQSPANLDRALAMMRDHVDSEVPEVLDTLGWLHYRRGELEEAIRYARAAIARGGRQPVMHYHLGLAYFAGGRRDEAKRELLTVVQGAGPGAARDHAAQVLASMDLASRSN